MKYLFFIFFILIISCEINEAVNNNQYAVDSIPSFDSSSVQEKTDTFDVVYAGWGEDCRLPLIELSKKDTARISELSGFHYWDIYYAYNLDNKFCVNDSTFSVILRKLRNDEIVVCTMRGISYPIVFVINAEWADKIVR